MSDEHALREEVAALRIAMLDRAHAHTLEMADLAPEGRVSATNLRHAQALREGLRPTLRRGLRAQGLSSLSDAEAHAMRSVELVMGRLGAPVGHEEHTIDTVHAKRLAHERADALLGRPSSGRATRIMVTLPSHAAEDGSVIRSLIDAGTDVVRINCAHDNEHAWGRMIAHLRGAERATGRSCKVFMDLGGPKVRTGPLPEGHRVAKFYPKRDGLGRVRRPARVLLRDDDGALLPGAPVDATIPVRGVWASTLAEGELVRTIDARGKRRTMRVIERRAGGAIVSCDAAVFLVPGSVLERLGPDDGVVDGSVVGTLPAREEGLLLRPGYLLRLLRDPSVSEQATFDVYGVMRTAPAIGCTLAEAFEHLCVNDRVLFDDGKVSARVVRLTEEGALLEITGARNDGATLRSDKGINFPGTRIDVPSLTRKDRRDLAFVARHADIVGQSFVRTPEDVRALQGALREHTRGGPGPGIIVKIETASCVEHLEGVLTALLASPSAGVMIARGDLAVEMGWERLAEVQRRILWLAGAAHLPVVWATQVLESLAKKGQPTRAELTDAAESERADCVMLNKGPYIGRAVSMLARILERAEGEPTPA